MIINSLIKGSGGAPAGKYQLLQRIKDDSNNEIGTVCGFHKDSNNTEYAVVCLDAQYRLYGGAFLSAEQKVTGLPLYNGPIVWEQTESATSSCDKVIAYLTSQGLTSASVSHCRSKSFVINGITYYGQLPILREIMLIMNHLTAIKTADPTASLDPNLNFPNRIILSCSQYSTQYIWGVTNESGQGGAGWSGKTVSSRFVCPILELPNA